MTDDEIWTKFVYTKGISERERAITFAREILTREPAAPVAPAVDAQPVAIYQTRWAYPETVWGDVTKDVYDRYETFGYVERRTVYTAAQSEGLRKALTEIAEQEHIELMLDPTWAQRVAVSALSQKDPQ